MEMSRLHALLQHLAPLHMSASQGDTWQGWQIQPLAGGTNNRLYRAYDGEHDLVIKWCIRDARRRAMREYVALTALASSGIAPQAVLVDETTYSQPVVVQTWVPGTVLTEPATADEAWWQALVECLVRIHRHPIPEGSAIAPALINAHSVATGRQLIQTQLDAIPVAHQPDSLRVLIRGLETTAIAELPASTMTLCHVDSNCRNFIWTTRGMMAVDWENSGWGDPAFEIAELIAHPAYMAVPHTRWQWVIDAYCRMWDNPPAMRQRIETHLRVYRVWWVARFARYLYEVPRQRDERLVHRATDWQVDIQTKYDHYLADAWRGLEE